MRYADRLDGVIGSYQWEGNKLTIVFDEPTNKYKCDVCGSSHISKSNTFKPTSNSLLVRDYLMRGNKKTLCQSCNRLIGSSIHAIRADYLKHKFDYIQGTDSSFHTCETFTDAMYSFIYDMSKKEGVTRYSPEDTEEERELKDKREQEIEEIGRNKFGINDDNKDAMHNMSRASADIYYDSVEYMKEDFFNYLRLNQNIVSDIAINFIIRKIKKAVK
jgi:hypothetical protein